MRLFNETKESLEQQTATSAVLNVISRSVFDLQKVFDTIVENAARLCGASRCGLFRLEDDGLRIAAAWNANQTPERVERDVAAFRKAYNLFGKAGAVAEAVRDGRPVQVDDVQVDPAYLGVPRGTARTVLAVPLLRDGRPVGALRLGREEVRRFTDREIRLVETFADQAVIAIENVRLFNEIRGKSAQLETANRDLADASRHKSEFLANMSHELRTPLNAIIGFSDVLEQRMAGELSAKQAEYIQDISSSGKHLLDLVNDILDLSKVEAGRMELEPSEFALADTIRAAVAFVRERASRHGIELAVDLAPDLGTVIADERKIRQVVLNLLSNAVKFTPDGGWIGVSARRTDGEVTVSVKDTGIGIAPEDQAKVFEEFQQVGKRDDRSREGTGLGLTLAKRFIELHGGRIWIESELGKGTTFTFALPLGRTAIPN